jgi:hypothetical protein
LPASLREHHAAIYIAAPTMRFSNELYPPYGLFLILFDLLSSLDSTFFALLLTSAGQPTRVILSPTEKVHLTKQLINNRAVVRVCFFSLDKCAKNSKARSFLLITLRFSFRK